jgi:hypothetical protein
VATTIQGALDSRQSTAPTHQKEERPSFADARTRVCEAFSHAFGVSSAARLVLDVFVCVACLTTGRPWSDHSRSAYVLFVSVSQAVDLFAS